MVIENSAHGAPQEGFAQSPSRANGCRRITLEMRARLDQADGFKGLPSGTAKPLTFLFAFQDAEPYLGLPPHAFKLVSWLVGLTDPKDWEEGSRPIASPSAVRQREFLGGLSPQRVKALNRALQEAGIFVMRDHPQGRRFCRRGKKTGRIIEAYGFDLSLLALRYDEFVRIAAAAKIEREHMRDLKRRKSLARRAIDQAAEELSRQGHGSETLDQLKREATDLVKVGSACTSSNELAYVVKSLESRRATAEQMLRDLIQPVETDPKGQQNEPHITSTSLPANHINDTVIAAKDCSSVEAPPVPNDQERSKPKHLFPETLHITPATLVELAPRLASYMPARTNDKNWPAIVDAAQYLSGEMGVNHTLWTRACDVMGREYTAVAMAIVSTKRVGPDHENGEIESPGQYFSGMLRKFEKNPQDLCLSRTLYGLKEQTWGKEGHKERREVERRRRIEERTKKSAYPALASIAAKALDHPDGGFKPARNVLPSPAAIPLVTPAAGTAQRVPAGSATASTTASKHWRPPAGLLEEARQVGLRIRQHQHDEQIKATLTNPDNGTAPPDEDKE